MADVLPACLYMEIENDKITINRLEANTGNELKEPWVINAPFGSEESLSKYTDKRADENSAPTLNENLKASYADITDINGNKQRTITFEAGKDDDFVHSYKLVFLDENKNVLEFEETDYDNNVVHYDAEGYKINVANENYENGQPKKISEVLYFSDFVLGLENMADNAELRLPSNLPENTKYVSITAIDSWGEESNSVVCEVVL
uniref:hypothetical protein n=1 Tax=Eubacterium sp. TaxID=142586 RepID=UPI004028D209